MTHETSVGEEPSLYATYAAELQWHAVGLVWLGYQRLNRSSHMVADEDSITGELLKEMRKVLEDPDSAPEWAEHYSVNEQQRVDIPGQQGKSRPIIDVEFERHTRGKRPRLRFEAKRLRRENSVGAYLGEDGLAAFLSGHYPTTHGEAGMLGYVQDETLDAWARKISSELNGHPSKHRVAANGQWRALPPPFAGTHAFRTAHEDVHNVELSVIHVLLDFVI